MQNQLVLFIENNLISVFRKEEDKYENLRIKGEVFHNYEDIEEGLKFVYDYLLNIFQIEDYSEFEIILYHSEDKEEVFNEIEDEFGFGNVIHLSIDLLKTYQKVKKEEFAEKTEEFKNKVLQSVRKEEELNNKIKEYLPIVKKWEKLKKELPKPIERELVTVVEKKAWEKFRISKTNRSEVKKGNKIGDIVFKRSSKRINSPATGYIYWFAILLYDDKILSIENLYGDNNENAIIAVISNTPKDSLDEIIKFVEKELERKG